MGGKGMPTNGEQPTQAERAAGRKVARRGLARQRHAEWDSARRTVDPLDLLAEPALTRVPELVPIRHGRTTSSPFAYHRGAALAMAADQATTSHPGVVVQLRGTPTCPTSAVRHPRSAVNGL
jgi:hypothetical protein